MEIYVQVIFILAFMKYSLKAALSGSLAGISLYALFPALLSLLVYPVVIRQPGTLLQDFLSNVSFLSDGALVTTVEAVAGIFVSVFLLDNYFMPESKRRRSIFLLKIIPGAMFFFALGYFELLFFREMAGTDFLVTALIFALIAAVAVFAFSLLIFFAVPAESVKLEMKILLNIGILIGGLLVNSSVADYNVSNSVSETDWNALLAVSALFLISAVTGYALYRFGVVSTIKKIIKWNL